tara:strand:- start:147 stop:455 length:309 start_codon:yes stop_codon:yes gene_type:complete
MDGTIEPIPEPVPESVLIDMLDQHWKLIGFTNRPSLEEMKEVGIDFLIKAINRTSKSGKYPKGWQLNRLKLQAMIIRDNATYYNGKRFNEADWLLHGRRLGL